MVRLSIDEMPLGEFTTLPEAFRAAKEYRHKNPADARKLIVQVWCGSRTSGWFLAP